MSESNSKSQCPKCSAELPLGAPGGLCPLCLMAGAMEPTGPAGEKPEPPSIEEVQAAFEQLEILEVIGVGGMGVVYRAKQTALNREVALKLLAPHREQEPGFAERFTREAQALAAMNHPNIVTIHDFGQAGGFFYLLMEFIDGVNLREAMKAGKFTPEEALAIVPPICEALQYAHDCGIVHRDIKPENLLLDKAGHVTVADFGIARILNLAEPNEDGSAQENIDSTLTVGTALGTPNYMAPEQADAPEKVDHRADIYSLGAVFYEMLTGAPPKGPISPPSTRGVRIDVRLDQIVLRALADSPELRWQSATDLRTEVETVVSNQAAVHATPPPIPPAAAAPESRKMRRFGAALLATIALSLGGFVLLGSIRGHGIGLLGIGILAVVSTTIAYLFFTRAPTRVAKGCGLIALILIFGFLGVVLLWNVSGPREITGEGRNHDWEAASTAPTILQLSNPTVSTNAADRSAKLAFAYVPKTEEAGWHVWLVTRQFSLSGGKPHSNGTNSHRLNFNGGVAEFKLENLASDYEEAFENFAQIDGSTVQLRPGAGFKVLDFSTPSGQSVDVELELRPSSNQTGKPGNLLFLREVDSYIGEGSISLAYNDIEYVGDYELMLETRGAAVQWSSHDQFELADFETDVDYSAMLFSRRKLHGGGSLRFDFPPIQKGDNHSTEPPHRASPIFIGMGETKTLFDLKDPKTNHHVSAKFRLVRTGTLAEVIPNVPAPNEEALPGSPLPPAPSGALWVAERRISIPDEFVIKVNIEISDRDAAYEVVQEPLIVKMPNDDARGIALRWRVYPADHPTHPNGYLVDLIAGGSGAIFHRFDGVFEEPVRMESPSTRPLPDNKKSSVLAEVNNRHYYGLIRATEPVPEGVGITQWWEIRAAITVPPLHDWTGPNSPEYQLPPSGHLKTRF
ncbi:MAG: putative Ser/Thr protein kinase [Verrucomicrobiales bacterium]|jgi:predicted Ser/Thr protein kinase